MASLDDKLKQINKALKQLEAIGGNINIFNPNAIKNIKDADDLLSSINSDIKEINDFAYRAYNSFSGIVKELSKGRSTTNQINKATRDLLGISTNLLNQQEGIVKFSEKQLLKEKEKAKIAVSSLQRLQKESELSGIQKSNIEATLNLQQLFVNQLENAAAEARAVENALGLTGNLLKSIVNIPGLSQFSSYFKLDESIDYMEEMSRKLIQTIRDSKDYKDQYNDVNKIISKSADTIENLTLEQEKLKKGSKEYLENEKKIVEAKQKQEEAQEDLTRLNKETAEESTGFAGKLAIGISGLGKTIENLGESLTDPAALFAILVKASSAVNTQVVSLQKNLALSYNEAQEIRKEFSSVADSQEDTFISTKKLLEAQSQFSEALGLQGKLSAENAKIFVDLTQRLGIAAESAAKLQLFAEATGINFEEQKLASYEIARSVSSQYGVQLNMKQVMDEVGKAGAYALIQNNGSVEALTEAVAQAKALGMNLQQVNSIAGKLLDFESSITNELQAELLIGRDINLERARLAALNNDQKTLMQEINREMGDFNDFTNMNRIQQEAFANSLGVSVEELSDMLLLEQYRGKNYAEISALAGEEVADRVEALSTQEKFNAAVEKMQDIFVNLAEGPLGDAAQLLSTILGSTIGMSAALGALVAGPLVKFVGFLKTARKLSVATAIADIFKGNAKFGPLGIAAAGAGVAAMVGAISTYSKEDDLMLGSQPGNGYGKRVISAPEGTFALNNKDTIIAGTKLSGNSPSTDSTPPPQINIDNKTGEQTNRLLATLINQNSKKPQLSPVGLYEVQ